MSASLGGLLKDYRLQKNYTQMEIAFALGWKETSRLSRIEQGKTEKPPRMLLDKIFEVMKLKEEEKNHLLLVGSYLPTIQEIEKIREKTDQLIRDWPYPASVLDYSWRVIHSNEAVFDVYQINKENRKKIYDKLPRIPEITFDPEFVLNKSVVNENQVKERDDFLTKMIMHYKYSQRTRTKDKWYIDLIKSMLSNPHFRRLWIRAQTEEELEIATNYSVKKVIHPRDSKKILTFYFFMVPFLKDSRFIIEFYTPADSATFKYFQS